MILLNSNSYEESIRSYIHKLLKNHIKIDDLRVALNEKMTTLLEGKVWMHGITVFHHGGKYYKIQCYAIEHGPNTVTDPLDYMFDFTEKIELNP